MKEEKIKSQKVTLVQKVIANKIKMHLAEKNKHMINLELYSNDDKVIGIGEHAILYETVEELIEKVLQEQEKLDTLQNLFPEIYNVVVNN